MAKVEIRSLPNGPNVVYVDDKPTVELCRCGHSGNKPFCDGTHAKVRFMAPKASVPIVP